MGDNMRLVDADALLSELEKYNDLSAKYKDDYLYGLQQRLETCIELVEDAPTVDAVPVIRCKDCSNWCICHHSDNWFCADGTPINTASDFYDDKGKRLNNPQTYKSIYGERKDDETDKR